MDAIEEYNTHESAVAVALKEAETFDDDQMKEVDDYLQRIRGLLQTVRAGFKSLDDQSRRISEERRAKDARVSAQTATAETLAEVVAEKDKLKVQADAAVADVARANNDFSKTQTEVAMVTRRAKEAVEDGKVFKNLQARKDFYYRVSRINWQTGGSDSKARGFVVNALKNDVISFKLDKKEHNEFYLWDCIGSGVDAAWKSC